MEVVEIELNDEANNIVTDKCQMDTLNVPDGDELEEEFSEEDEGE